MSNYEKHLQDAINLVSQHFNSFQIDNMTASQIQWHYGRLLSEGYTLRPEKAAKSPFNGLVVDSVADMSKYSKQVNVVYFFYGACGDLLYVGRTNNFRTRWYDHCKSEKAMHLVECVKLHVFETKSEVVFYESQKILEMKPLWNKAGTRGFPSTYQMEPVEIDTFLAQAA